MPFNRIQSGKHLHVVFDETPHFYEGIDDFDAYLNRRVTAEHG